MGEIIFVGLGLHDELGMSLQALEEIKAADSVFIETYTSLMPGFSMENFRKITGKSPRIVSRKELEEKDGETILSLAKTKRVVLLVPGDPLIATTHVALRIQAEKQGMKTRLVHGASIVSAVMGLSGLHNYKFGKSVTVPFPDETPSETPNGVIAQNRKLGLHTLCLLDMNTEKKRYLTIREALEALLGTENKKKDKSVTNDTLAIGIARAGSKEPKVRASIVKDLLIYDFGAPPHTVIFPGKLHFMEAEALITLARAPEKIRAPSR